jgi:hypothetical protein
MVSDLLTSTTIFGNSMRPFNVSANNHIVGVSNTAPQNAATPWKSTNVFSD